jgi:hypothetical protein
MGMLLFQQVIMKPVARPARLPARVIMRCWPATSA